MAPIPTRTLRDYFASLPSGPSFAGLVDQQLVIRNDIGGIQSVSVATANGLAGVSDADPVSPVLTLSTTVSGVLKGNGTAISAAVSNTDYQAPIALTTIGTSGVATFNGTTLNIPNYADTDTGITQLTGDVTAGPGSGSQVATLANVVSASTQTKITYNAKGLVTAGAQAAASDLSNGTTGTGNIVLANSPTLVTPNLGTPSAINLTNATNVPPPIPRVSSVASTATLTPNASTTDVAAITAQAAGLTVAAPTGTPTDGQRLTIRIRDNGTARAIAWNAIYTAWTPTDLRVITVITKTLIFEFVYNSTETQWQLLHSNASYGIWS